MKTCSTNLSTLDLKVIGAGGFGTIYELPSGDVIKAIVSKDVCGDAEIELQKQQKAWLAFEKLKTLDIVEFSTLLLVQKLVIISKPIVSCKTPITISDRKFSCYFQMEKLEGFPIGLLEKFKPGILKKVDATFIKERGLNFPLMVQLSLNSELPSHIYGVDYSKKAISTKNPPRGFFLNDKSNFINLLRDKYNFPYDFKIIKRIIGFIYAYLFYFAQLIPIDIEIALGLYNNKVKINVLDFGLTIDLTDLSNIPHKPRTQSFVSIFKSNKSKAQKIAALEIKTKEVLAIDLYCDVEDDKDCVSGWNEVANSVIDKFHNLSFDL